MKNVNHHNDKKKEATATIKTFKVPVAKIKKEIPKTQIQECQETASKEWNLRKEKNIVPGMQPRNYKTIQKMQDQINQLKKENV